MPKANEEGKDSNLGQGWRQEASGQDAGDA